MRELTDNKVFAFDEFVIDAHKGLLTRKGATVPLKSRAFDLLLLLVERRGEVISKNELLETIWENQFVEENNLTVQMSALRKALGEARDSPRFLITVPGKGYKFIGDVKPSANVYLFKPVEQIEPLTIVEKPRTVSSGSSIRRFFFAAVVLSVLVIAAGGFWLLSRQRSVPPAVRSSKDLSIRRLTTDGLVTNSALSPDGKLFAYSHLDGEYQSLWLGHVDGGEPVQIRPPALVVYLDFKFSPDEKSIYYTLTNHNGSSEGVFKIPVFGGVPEKIEDKNYTIAFSPTGKQFAFVRRRDEDSKPVVVASDSDGKNERVIAVSPDAINFSLQAGAWSPDGSTIALGASRSDTNTGYEVYTVNVADGSTKALTSAAWNRVGAMAWLADGSGLVMVGQKEGSVQPQLWSVSFPGGEIKHLVSDLNLYASTVGLGKDQNTLLSVQAQVQSNIWTAPADDLSKAKQLTFGSIGRRDGNGGLRWTTEDTIVYASSIGDNNTIWTMNARGGDQKQLIPSDGNNIFPSLPADGRFVVFQSNRGGSFGVWRSNRDGTDIRKLTDTGIAAQPDVSPDGRWVVYVTSPEDSGELWRIPISGGEPLKLANGASWPQFSADGKFIACEYLFAGKSKLGVFSIDGGDPLYTFEIPVHANLRLGIHWTPDGKAITYRDWINGIWRQDLAGGEPQRLKGLPSEKLYAYDWSPDGKQFAFTRGTETRDVVLISDFR